MKATAAQPERESEVGRGAERERRETTLAVLALVVFQAAWHAPGLFEGRAYVAEDTLAYFASNRAVHHAWIRDILAQGSFQWWDPLPGLGQPRLANIQNGTFAPVTLLFYLWPAATVLCFYPFVVASALSLATFALFRSKGATPFAAVFGALSWTTLASVTTHFQHPPAFETLLWLPVALWGWERFRSRRQARYALVSGAAVACQAFASSPQYLLYDALVMGLWISQDLWQLRHDKRELAAGTLAATAIAGLGFCLASWQLLPFAEMARLGHRELLSDPAVFGDLLRASPAEVLRSLAAEQYWLREPAVLTHGAPYRESANLSSLVVVLAVFGLVAGRGPRPWLLVAGAVFFLAGMLGSAGGTTPLLGQVVPFADRLRAPIRMLVPAGFLIAWLAACGADRLPLRGRVRTLAAAGAALWVALVSWTLVRPLDHYVDPAVYTVPAPIAEARGRIAVDALASSGMPLFALNAGLAAGVPTLLQREVLIPASLFEGWFFSQLDAARLPPDVRQARMDRMIVAAALPIVDATSPLLRSWGLRTVILFEGGRIRAIPVGDPVPRFRWVGEVRTPPTRETLQAELYAGRWDPQETVLLREPLPRPLPVDESAGPAVLRVLEDAPDRQRLQVRTPGGLIVTSGLLFPGWEVRVDGERARPLEVDLALRAVVVPPGEHLVEWRYRPTWLAQAMAASVLAALLAVALVGLARWRRRLAAR